jgi:Tol biopolymer transport system component
VASIDDTGLARVLAEGTATVTATYNGQSGSSQMHVTAPAPSGRVAFVSTRSGNAEIYSMNADSSDVMKLTD